MTTRNKPTRKKPRTINTTGKILLSTFSLGMFLGGWNLIAQQAQPSDEADNPTATIPPSPIVYPTATHLNNQPEIVLPPIPTTAPLSSGLLTDPGQPVSTIGVPTALPEFVLPSPTPSPVTVIPATPTLAPLPPQNPTPFPTSAPAAVANTLSLVSPLNGSTSGPIDFEWIWQGPIPAGYGFEVLVWQPGQPVGGAHDAVNDNLSGRIQNLGGGRYRLHLDISYAAGVQNRGGSYLWTVSLVQISPNYAPQGIQAPPSTINFGQGGGGGVNTPNQPHQTQGS